MPYFPPIYRGATVVRQAPVLALGVVRVASRRELGGLPLPLGLGVSPPPQDARSDVVKQVAWIKGDLQ
jgi:hypothetical protein